MMICFYFVKNTVGQTFKPDSIPCLRLNAVEEGKRFEDKRYFKYFALLLQDTCSSFNRFTNYFYSSTIIESNQLQKYYPATIIDSDQVFFIEQYFKGKILTDRHTESNNKSSRVTVRNLNKYLYHYIRLYVGFVNDHNDTCIVIQFVKPKEYKNDKFYSKQMDLIARSNKTLRFIILRKRENELRLEESFPADFLKSK